MPSSTSKTSMIGRFITITHCYGCGRSKHVLKLERELGSGACGTVYEAVDLTSRSGARYAVKHTHRTDLLEDEVGAHSLCSDSPGVVTLHDFIEDGPRNAFVVMDLVRGGDLFDALQEIHSRDFYRKDAHIKQIALQLIDALSYCHTRGVFHRDLKPENILISEDGKQVYITDFGFAYGKHACHQFGYGSVPYMSPECINGRPGDKPYSTRHGDLWSLGVILLMLITGHSAWAHASLRTGRHRPDPSFALFVRRPKGFLSRMFPLSPSAEQLFLAVFAPSYRQRPTLEQLRMAIATSETFYLTDDEMALAPALLREFDADHRRCLLSPPCSPTASTRAIPPSPRAPTFPDVSPMPAFHLALDPFAPAPATAAARESSFEDVQLHAAPSALQKPKIQPVFVITNRTSRDLISPVSPVQPTAMSVAAKPASPVRPRAQPVLDLLAEEEERIDEGAWYLGSPPRRVRDDSSSEDRVFDRPMTPPTPPADMFVIGDDSDEESEGPVTPETYPVADVPVGKEAKVLGGAERLLSLLSI